MALRKFLNPKNCVAFKRIFGTEKNKDIVRHFRKDVLSYKDYDKIKGITFLSPNQNPDIAWPFNYSRDIIEAELENIIGSDIMKKAYGGFDKFDLWEPEEICKYKQLIKAKIMLDDSVPVAFIASLTGLSEEEIVQLKEELAQVRAQKLKEGGKLGIKQGIEMAMTALAKIMLKNSVDVATIASRTGLSEEKIVELKEEIAQVRAQKLEEGRKEMEMKTDSAKIMLESGNVSVAFIASVTGLSEEEIVQLKEEIGQARAQKLEEGKDIKTDLAKFMLESCVSVAFIASVTGLSEEEIVQLKEEIAQAGSQKLEEGKEMKTDIAKFMLENNVPVAFIASVTGLSEEEIEQLKEEIAQAGSQKLEEGKEMKIDIAKIMLENSVPVAFIASVTGLSEEEIVQLKELAQVRAQTRVEALEKGIKQAGEKEMTELAKAMLKNGVPVTCIASIIALSKEELGQLKEMVEVWSQKLKEAKEGSKELKTDIAKILLGNSVPVALIAAETALSEEEIVQLKEEIAQAKGPKAGRSQETRPRKGED